MKNQVRVALRSISVRFTALLHCALFYSCIAEPQNESEGPHEVSLISSNDTCSRARMSMYIDDLFFFGPFAGAISLPESFFATEGRHTIAIYCQRKRDTSTSDVVWIDTVEIVSDTSFVLDCLNCEIEP